LHSVELPPAGVGGCWPFATVDGDEVTGGGVVALGGGCCCWEVLSGMVGTWGFSGLAVPPSLHPASSSTIAAPPLTSTPVFTLDRSMVIASTWPRHHWTLSLTNY
jgi:hypothetical protein